MPKVTDILGLLMYDSSPGERLRTMRVLYRTTVLIFGIWAVGSFSPLGFSGFARANDVEKKIQEAVEPINAQLGAITTQLARSDEIQKRILISQMTAQLRDLNRLRCSSQDDHVVERAERDIESTQQEYRALTGERYPMPACKDL